VRSGHFLVKLFFAQLTNPGRFRRARPIDTLRPELAESQGWDEYWSEKRTALGAVYDLVATVYRRGGGRHLRRVADRAFARAPPSGLQRAVPARAPAPHPARVRRRAEVSSRRDLAARLPRRGRDASTRHRLRPARILLRPQGLVCPVRHRR